MPVFFSTTVIPGPAPGIWKVLHAIAAGIALGLCSVASPWERLNEFDNAEC